MVILKSIDGLAIFELNDSAFELVNGAAGSTNSVKMDVNQSNSGCQTNFNCPTPVGPLELELSCPNLVCGNVGCLDFACA